MDTVQAIAALVDKQALTAAQMRSLMQQMMTGQVSDSQLAALLVALHMKGETVTEIVAAVEVMRDLLLPVDVQGDHLIDIVGTGGDGANLFNVSTAAALVASAAGAQVAKHGNRSVSSRSGSADLLEAAGVCLDIDAPSIARCIEDVGIGFMFALYHHQAMKHVMPVRQALRIRTLFNLVGPLTNPARVRKQVIGVFARHWLRPMAEVLQQLGSQHVLVVHSADGLDEISLAHETHVLELKNDVIREYTVTPEQFGIDRKSTRLNSSH